MKKYLIALLFVPAMAQAEFLDGNMLLSRIHSSNVSDNLVAMGYIQGIFDANQRATHCAPSGSGITVGQVYDMVKHYLEANPSIRHRTADMLVADVFKQVWPCQRRGTGV